MWPFQPFFPSSIMFVPSVCLGFSTVFLNCAIIIPLGLMLSPLGENFNTWHTGFSAPLSERPGSWFPYLQVLVVIRLQITLTTQNHNTLPIKRWPLFLHGSMHCFPILYTESLVYDFYLFKFVQMPWDNVTWSQVTHPTGYSPKTISAPQVPDFPVPALPILLIHGLDHILHCESRLPSPVSALTAKYTGL